MILENCVSIPIIIEELNDDADGQENDKDCSILNYYFWWNLLPCVQIADISDT